MASTGLMRERLSMRVVPRLLWIDGSGALVAGVIVLLFAPFLSGLHALPRSLLLATGVANLAYGAFSFTLARRARRPMALVQVLAVANIAWGVACMVTAAIVAADASRLGTCCWRGVRGRPWRAGVAISGTAGRGPARHRLLRDRNFNRGRSSVRRARRHRERRWTGGGVPADLIARLLGRATDGSRGGAIPTGTDLTCRRDRRPRHRSPRRRGAGGVRGSGRSPTPE
jgi:hypothetical protein